MSETYGEKPGKPVRRRLRLDGPGSVPTRTRAVKGVGRYTTTLYCYRCGHLYRRCICPNGQDPHAL